MTGVLDVTEAFDGLYTQVSLVKKDAGYRKDGKWIEGDKTEIPLSAVVHPIDENEINHLAIEGYRGNELLKIYFTDSKMIYITDNTGQISADEVIYNNFTYSILKITNWNKIGGYSKAYCERQT